MKNATRSLAALLAVLFLGSSLMVAAPAMAERPTPTPETCEQELVHSAAEVDVVRAEVWRLNGEVQRLAADRDSWQAQARNLDQIRLAVEAERDILAVRAIRKQATIDRLRAKLAAAR